MTPIILLFRTTPRVALPNNDYMPPDQKTRFKSMEEARREMETITAQSRVSAALKQQTGPDYS